ncbi:MAG: type II toxin-antitoxin system CcdA family antitoxin [Methylococcales bacterium]|nr:type II toxin-antitoxin system CcdA family antitoxin [Methylococcales bacterium]
MKQVSNPPALKRPTNVSINSELLLQAKQFKINLSATIEAALIGAINAKQRELWMRENEAAIGTYKQMVEDTGVFSDGQRSF